jgi:hypothetical protein
MFAPKAFAQRPGPTGLSGGLAAVSSDARLGERMVRRDRPVRVIRLDVNLAVRTLQRVRTVTLKTAAVRRRAQRRHKQSGALLVCSGDGFGFAF